MSIEPEIFVILRRSVFLFTAFPTFELVFLELFLLERMVRVLDKKYVSTSEECFSEACRIWRGTTL